MKKIILATWNGGSHLYSLNTPESDIDERELFMNTDPAYILGTKRFDQEVKNNEEEDIERTEIRKFLELAKKGNTKTLEVLFAKEEKFDYLAPAIIELRTNRNRLVDPDRLFTVISSFVKAQTFLIFNEERKAKEGSKRDIALKQYGYVPKAASTAVRLCMSGIAFFQRGFYEVEVHRKSLPGLIKFDPQSFTPEEIKFNVESFDIALKAAYENSRYRNSYRFDEDYVNEYLKGLYLPHLI